MKLGATKPVVWTMAPEDGAAGVEDYKFTFGSCTMAGSGRYWACMRDFGDWYEEQHGQTYELASQSKDDATRIAAVRLYNQANDYSAIMASLQTIETRTRSLDGAQEPGAWAPAEIPAEWGTFAGFYEAMPWVAVEALANAAHAVNPGLWRFQDSDTAKKNGGANGG